jgi:hypothetical protein
MASLLTCRPFVTMCLPADQTSLYHAVVACEHIAIQNGVAASSDQDPQPPRQAPSVCQLSHRDRAPLLRPEDFAPPSLTASNSRLSGGMFRRRQRRAGMVAKALRVIERPKFFRKRNADVGIGTDGNAAAGSKPAHTIEDAVAQARFGDRAEPRHGAASCKPLGFMRHHLRAMNETTPRVELHPVEHELDRPLSTGRFDFLHLGDLFGKMHVQRIFSRKVCVMGKVFRRHRPQAVRGDAESGRRPAAGRSPRSNGHAVPHRHRACCRIGSALARAGVCRSHHTGSGPAAMSVPCRSVHWLRRSVPPFRQYWRRASRRADGADSEIRHWPNTLLPASPSARTPRSPRHDRASAGRESGTSAAAMSRKSPRHQAPAFRSAPPSRAERRGCGNWLVPGAGCRSGALRARRPVSILLMRPSVPASIRTASGPSGIQ